MQPNSSPGCIRKYKQMYQEIQPKIYIQYHTCVMTPISFFILGITYKICICKLQSFMAQCLAKLSAVCKWVNVVELAHYGKRAAGISPPAGLSILLKRTFSKSILTLQSKTNTLLNGRIVCIRYPTESMFKHRNAKT